jgi:hypothetical protein
MCGLRSCCIGRRRRLPADTADAPRRFKVARDPVLLAPAPALLASPPRAKLLSHNRRASRRSACAATSAAEVRPASSTSSISASLRHNAARTAVAGSGSSASPKVDATGPALARSTLAVPPVLLPNRVRCVSLGVQKGRFSAGNRLFRSPWASKNTCKAWELMVPSEVDSLHYIAL